MGRLGADMIDLDFMVPLSEARRAMGKAQVLAGNLDPVRTIRNGSPDLIRAALADCYSQAVDHYIVAAGCEIPRDTPHQNVRALTDFARSVKQG